MRPDPPTHSKKNKVHRMATKVICIANLVYLGSVALISLASVFLYQSFARQMGAPFNAILRLPEMVVRGMMLGGLIVYGFAAFGIFLFMRKRPKGFWIYAIPGFLIITASLFLVFNWINMFQLVLLTGSILYLSTRMRPLKSQE